MSLVIRKEGATLIAEGWEDRESFSLDLLVAAIQGLSPHITVNVTFTASNATVTYQLDGIQPLSGWAEGRLVSE